MYFSCIYRVGLDRVIMELNSIFNNISVISWRSVLLVEETGVPRDLTTDLSQVSDKLYRILLYRVNLAWTRFKLTTLVVIGTDCIMVGIYKFNYLKITTMTALLYLWKEQYYKHYIIQVKRWHWAIGWEYQMWIPEKMDAMW